MQYYSLIAAYESRVRNTELWEQFITELTLSEPPIDAINICQKLKISVENSLINQTGYICNTSGGFVIYTDKTNSKAYNNFVIIRELAHLLFNEAAVKNNERFNFHQNLGVIDDNRFVLQANLFASEVLLEAVHFETHIKSLMHENEQNERPTMINEILRSASKMYFVSENVVYQRLKMLGYIVT